MISKRSQEGYLLVDNRGGPGLTDEQISVSTLPLGAGRGLFEAPTFTCSHCTRVVVLNPLRTRDRGYCGKCDHYVCDQCEAARVSTGECKTFKQYMDELDDQLTNLVI